MVDFCRGAFQCAYSAPLHSSQTGLARILFVIYIRAPYNRIVIDISTPSYCQESRRDYRLRNRRYTIIRTRFGNIKDFKFSKNE